MNHLALFFWLLALTGIFVIIAMDKKFWSEGFVSVVNLVILFAIVIMGLLCF